MSRREKRNQGRKQGKRRGRGREGKDKMETLSVDMRHEKEGERERE